MDVHDLSDIDDGEPLTCDICIVGSGPAGSTLLRELAGSGLQVILLESGGRSTQADSDALGVIESIGAAREMEPSQVRNRILGGTSHSWSGRCAPFDDIDYEQRPWVPHSGWPVTSRQMRPFLERTPSHLGLGFGADFTGEGFWARARRRKPASGFDPDLLEPFFWQFSRDTRNPHDHMRFGPTLLAQRLRDTRIVTNATVLQIIATDAVSAVTGVEVAGRDGRRRRVTARTVVLSAGGIENARLLLASNRQARGGLGNGQGLVGRFLMDHPRGSVARFDLSQLGGLSQHFGYHRARVGRRSFLFCQGVRLSPAAQAREGLLNCTAWLSEQVRHDDPWSAVKRILIGKARLRQDLLSVASHLYLVGRGVHAHVLRGGNLPRLLDQMQLTCIVEQAPDPDSRVTLSDRVDRFGMPLSRIDWRINEAETRTVRRTAQIIAAELARVGVAAPLLDEWVKTGAGFPSHYRDNAHPTGTTRMAATASAGVVDGDGQVHGIDGLFVTGSSIFPTSSHANPTQMIVAFAVRLADRLKQRARAPGTLIGVHSAAAGPTSGLDRAKPATMPALRAARTR